MQRMLSWIAAGVVCLAARQVPGAVLGGDGTPDPGYPGLWAWFRADDPDSVNGAGGDQDADPVTRWDDVATGGSHHLARSSDGPGTFLTHGVQGLPAVSFAGDADVWGAATTADEFQIMDNGFTLVVVARLNSNVGTQYLFDRTTSRGGVGLRAAGAPSLRWELHAKRTSSGPAVDVVAPTIPVVYGLFQVHTVTVEGTNMTHHVDGTLAGAGSFDDGGDRLEQCGLILGADVGTNGDADCDIAEILAYDEALSALDRQALETHLYGKYDLDSQPTPPPLPTPPVYVDVFAAGDGVYPKYRIPAFWTAQSGVLLAFCEARQGGDHSKNDIVLRRSLDGGDTWLPLQILWDDGGNSLNDPTVVQLHSGIHAGRLLLMFERFPEGCHTGCTVPGYDPNTSSLHYLMTSDDDGATWSAPLDISIQVKRPTATYAAVGPGRAVQLRHGTYAGRIVFPFRENNTRHMVYAVYSDDDGASWTIGELVVDTQTDGTANEVQVVERVDGSLLLNARRSTGSFRKMATSQDGGETWSPLQNSTLISPRCMASIVRYTDPLDGFRSRVLYAGPHSTSSRVNGTVHISYDEGTSWIASRSIYGGTYAYSVLSPMDGETIGCLFERDGYAYITLVRFDLRWLTGNRDSLDLDQDDMPDGWEDQHFGGTDEPGGGALEDWDADGMANQPEFVAGTLPTNALDVLSMDIRVLPDRSTAISFPTVPSDRGPLGTTRTYTLSTTETLTPLTAWNPVPGYTQLPATGSDVVASNISDSTQLYFRAAARLE